MLQDFENILRSWKKGPMDIDKNALNNVVSYKE